MVQISPLSCRSERRHLNIADRNTKISRLRLELLENVLVSRICRGGRAACIVLRSAADTAATTAGRTRRTRAALNFLRELRIKTASKFMQRLLPHFLHTVLALSLLLLVTSCIEEPRSSA